MDLKGLSPSEVAQKIVAEMPDIETFAPVFAEYVSSLSFDAGIDFMRKDLGDAWKNAGSSASSSYGSYFMSLYSAVCKLLVYQEYIKRLTQYLVQQGKMKPCPTCGHVVEGHDE